MGHACRKNKLYWAAQEVGRVERTIYLLRWISDPQLRANVTGGTNSVEGYHALSKWLHFGGEVIQENDPEEQQKRVRYLGLVTSAVIFWNVVEITRILNDLAAEGYPVKKEYLPFLKPYLTRQLKRFGDYTIHTELVPGHIDYSLGLSPKRPPRPIQAALPFLAEAEEHVEK